MRRSWHHVAISWLAVHVGASNHTFLYLALHQRTAPRKMFMRQKTSYILLGPTNRVHACHASCQLLPGFAAAESFELPERLVTWPALSALDSPNDGALSVYYLLPVTLSPEAVSTLVTHRHALESPHCHFGRSQHATGS